MPMRLQELHPSLVHFPIALLPVAIGADLLGRLTGSKPLLEIGRRLIPLAAGAAALAAVAGLAAQEEVQVEGEALDALITHRNLNLALVATATAMAAWRSSRQRPTATYLGLGLAGAGVMTYTAYLGGHMVYEHGVGVSPANGVRAQDVPELRAGTLAAAGRTFARDVASGARMTVQEVSEGKLVPAITHGSGAHGSGSEQVGDGAGAQSAGVATRA